MLCTRQVPLRGRGAAHRLQHAFWGDALSERHLKLATNTNCEARHQGNRRSLSDSSPPGRWALGWGQEAPRLSGGAPRGTGGRGQVWQEASSAPGPGTGDRVFSAHGSSLLEAGHPREWCLCRSPPFPQGPAVHRPACPGERGGGCLGEEVPGWGCLGGGCLGGGACVWGVCSQSAASTSPIRRAGSARRPVAAAGTAGGGGSVPPTAVPSCAPSAGGPPAGPGPASPSGTGAEGPFGWERGSGRPPSSPRLRPQARELCPPSLPSTPSPVRPSPHCISSPSTSGHGPEARARCWASSAGGGGLPLAPPAPQPPGHTAPPACLTGSGRAAPSPGASPWEIADPGTCPLPSRSGR